MPLHDTVKQRFKSVLSLHSRPQYQVSSEPPNLPAPVATLHDPRVLPLHSGGVWASPFTRLPFEIHVEIFSYCPTEFPRIDSQSPLSTLTLVSKTWHHLVMTTPRLWSCFEIVLEGTGCSYLERGNMTKRLQLWLRRSRQYPLSFRIIHNYTGGAADLRSAELFNILLPHSSRWQNVQFRGPSGALAHLPIALPEGNLPALKSLLMHVNKSWDTSFNLNLFRVPWLQLSELDLQLYQDNAHTLDQCFQILSAARNLAACTLSANCIFTVNNAEKIPLPSLRSLKIIAHGDHSAAETNLLGFLELLSVAGLKAFSLDWLANRAQEDSGLRWEAVHPRLTTLLHSSAESLEQLGLAYLPLRDYEILSCLDGLPNLKVLALKFSFASHQTDPITGGLLEYLTHLPLLNTLRLQCSGENLDQVKLMALIEGRAIAGQLEVFEILTMKHLSKDFRERTAVWRSRGFSFSASALSTC